MPNFEITGPDGAKYQVTGARDEQHALDTFRTFYEKGGGFFGTGAQKPPLDPSQPNSDQKSGGSGVTNAGIIVSAPNGATVTFPNGTDYDTIDRAMRENFSDVSPEPPSGFVLDQPDTLTDVAKSAGTGVVKGTIDTLGAPGDVGSLLSGAVTKAGTALGASPESVQRFKNIAGGALADNPVTAIPARLLQGPSSQDLTNKLQAVTGPLYEPKTTLGEYAQTAGEFVPNMIGGPESLGTKAITRVVAPALASETAGQMTKGTEAEPYARTAGALLGGALGGAVTTPRATTAAIPTAADLKTAAKSGYNHPDVAAVQIKPAAVDNLATTIENDLVSQGFRGRAGQGGTVFDTIGEMKNAPGPVSVADLDSVRKALGQVGKSGIPTPDSVAANKAIAHIDDFLPNLNQSDLLAGDASAASQILQDARGNWAAASRSGMLNDKIDAAELQAASANSGHNVENALRQRVRSILTSPKLSRGLNDDERQAMEDFVRGGPITNTVRHIGNFLGGGGGLGHLLTAGAGAVTAGVPGAIAAPAAGLALRAASNANAARQVRNIDNLIRSRAPAAQAA